MADVRVNGKRIPPLQAIDTMSVLIDKLENLAHKSGSALTSLSVNNHDIDFENKEFHRMKLEQEDTIDVKFDSAEQLSFETLQVALDMADLLMFDLKVASIKIWDGEPQFEKPLETLLEDCHLFLSLAARPIYLLNKDPLQMEVEAQTCLQELDRIASYVENATLLAVRGFHKESCTVLVGMVQAAIERWVGLSAIFAQSLQINQVEDQANSLPDQLTS
jgi:hypothetical protein